MSAKNKNRNLLVKLFGASVILHHGDTLMFDRWCWLRARLPRIANQETLMDVGCGGGAFVLGAARRGYTALGLTWDESDQRTAVERAEICHLPNARFEIQDARQLLDREDLFGKYDVITCTECIEHIIDDRKLMRAMACCLKPGGRLLLTSPNYFFRPIGRLDTGYWATVEEGGHMRRGYTRGMYAELCREAGLAVEEISFCSGYVSQRLTEMLRFFSRLHPLLGWGVVLPFRWLPPVVDPWFSQLTGYPGYSICLEAYKPRFATVCLGA